MGISRIATWKVSFAVMASRVLGLVREMVFAGLFGGSRWLDCFYLAFKVPNLLRDLFAEGALSQAFVTTFTKRLKTDGDRPAWDLASKMLTLAAVFMSVVCAIGMIVAPHIVEGLTFLARHTDRKYDPAELALITTMVRIMFPFIALLSLSALVMGMLNAKNIFGIPALSSCCFNLGSIIGGVSLGWWLDPEWGPRSLIGFSIGVLIGGLAQLSCQFPALRGVGYRWYANFQWRDSGVHKVIKLMVPAVIAASVVQVNVLVNAIFAYGVDEGAVTWLNLAFRLMQLPIGVFGVAVATVTLPMLSRASTTGITEEFRSTLQKGIGLVAFLVLPSTLVLVMLAEPIVSVLYERGNFDAHDRSQTALALRAYGYGLLCYAWIKVIQPSFYAIDRRWVPMLVSLGSIGINIGLNYHFVFNLGWGHEALALTTSVVACVNFLALFIAMRVMAGDIGTSDLLSLLSKLLVAGAVLAAICLYGERMLFTDLGNQNILQRLVGLILVSGFAGLGYLVMCHLLRVAEVRDAVAILARKLKTPPR
ncbi:MAG: murein biosynthesis integral membrane protein MurJ [Akkermansiaceae bacterium]|nr:murein biosynthesis integral membrane protein MurJ [Akkermansiaceae bacterium]